MYVVLNGAWLRTLRKPKYNTHMHTSKHRVGCVTRTTNNTSNVIFDYDFVLPVTRVAFTKHLA